MLQEELGVRAARLKGITDVVPVSRNGSADSDSGDEDSDVKKGALYVPCTGCKDEHMIHGALPCNQALCSLRKGVTSILVLVS